MSAIKALEELREWSRLGPMVCQDLLDIADKIEAEIAERFMELPMDADGVPIRIGDTVCEVDDRTPVKVMSLTFYEDCVDVNVCGMNPNLLRHVKPRTVEDVLREFTEKYQCCISDNGRSITLAKYAAEIRELLGGGRMSAITMDTARDLIERHSDHISGNTREFYNGAYEEIADELNSRADFLLVGRKK